MTRKMKDSGIEWIGEIPEDWNARRIKNILSERNLKNDTVITNVVLSLLKDRGVIPYSEKGNIGNKAKEDITKYKVAYPEDIIMNSMNVIIGSVNISRYTGVVSPVYYVLYVRNENEHDIDYINMLFQTKQFQESLKGIGNGILEHRMRIPINKLNDVILPFPSKKEQIKIVEILKRKTRKLDNIINETQQSIEELKKYKQSLITEAVTKGLDPNVAMREVECDYTKLVPFTWISPKLKHLCTMNSGKNLSAEEIEDSGLYKVYGANGFRGYYNDFNAEGELLLVGRQGALSGNVHYINEEIWATDHALITRTTDIIDTKFLYYLIKVMNFNQYAHNAAQPGISASFVLQLPTYIPSNLEEQRQIVSYLDEQTSRIDKLIADKTKVIEELEDYKMSLIYEYVTGKKEV